MTEPISIFDLRRKTKTVEVNDGEAAVAVTGLTAAQICDHLANFPVLASLSIGGTVSPMDMIKAAPGSLAAWGASALGHHGDVAAEKAFSDNLTAEDQANVVQESMGLTFSRGFGPFVDRMAGLMGNLTVGPGRVPATRSPTRSPPPRPEPESSPTEPGTSPLDSSPLSTSSPSSEGSSESPAT